MAYDKNAPEEQPENDSYESGTAQSGFVSGDVGPFACSNCTKFVNGFCTEPKVVNDPEAQKLRRLAPQGLQTHPDDCCNYIETPAMEQEAHEGGEEEPEPAEEQESPRESRVNKATKMLGK